MEDLQATLLLRCLRNLGEALSTCNSYEDKSDDERTSNRPSDAEPYEVGGNRAEERADVEDDDREEQHDSRTIQVGPTPEDGLEHRRSEQVGQRDPCVALAWPDVQIDERTALLWQLIILRRNGRHGRSYDRLVERTEECCHRQPASSVSSK